MSWLVCFLLLRLTFRVQNYANKQYPVSRIPVRLLRKPETLTDRSSSPFSSGLSVPIRYKSVRPRKWINPVKLDIGSGQKSPSRKLNEQPKTLDRPVQLYVKSKLPMPIRDGDVPTRVFRRREQSIRRYSQSQPMQQQPTAENSRSIKREIFDLK